MRVRFRPWRIVNVILLVGAFFGPWLSSWAEDSANNDPFLGHQVVRIALEFATSSLIEGLLFRGMCAVFLIGVVFTGLYSFANIIEFSGATQNWRRSRLMLLAGSLLANLVLLLRLAYEGSLLLMQWGYWLMWAGLISSTILEFAAWRKNDADSTARGSLRKDLDRNYRCAGRS